MLTNMMQQFLILGNEKTQLYVKPTQLILSNASSQASMLPYDTPRYPSQCLTSPRAVASISTYTNLSIVP